MKCVICGMKVDRGGSFSNQGENVHCVHCVERLSSGLGCSVSDYLKKYVWPYRDKDILQVKHFLAQELREKAQNVTQSCCDSLVSESFPVERYRCHSRTKGIPLDTQGYVYSYWSRFENGMEVQPEFPVDFTKERGGLVAVRRFYIQNKTECLESGRVAIPLDSFRKCFIRVK